MLDVCFETVETLPKWLRPWFVLTENKKCLWCKEDLIEGSIVCEQKLLISAKDDRLGFYQLTFHNVECGELFIDHIQANGKDKYFDLYGGCTETVS